MAKKKQKATPQTDMFNEVIVKKEIVEEEIKPTVKEDTSEEDKPDNWYEKYY